MFSMFLLLTKTMFYVEHFTDYKFNFKILVFTSEIKHSIINITRWGIKIEN